MTLQQASLALRSSQDTGERIYHMPLHQRCDSTRVDESAGERWFFSEEEVLAAGWRRALR